MNIFVHKVVIAVDNEFDSVRIFDPPRIYTSVEDIKSDYQDNESTEHFFKITVEK